MARKRKPVDYWSRKDIAAFLGVTTGSLGKVVLPDPDATIGRVRGWLPATVEAWAKLPLSERETPTGARRSRARWAPAEAPVPPVAAAEVAPKSPVTLSFTHDPKIAALLLDGKRYEITRGGDRDSITVDVSPGVAYSPIVQAVDR